MPRILWRSWLLVSVSVSMRHWVRKQQYRRLFTVCISVSFRRLCTEVGIPHAMYALACTVGSLIAVCLWARRGPFFEGCVIHSTALDWSYPSWLLGTEGVVWFGWWESYTDKLCNNSYNTYYSLSTTHGSKTRGRYQSVCAVGYSMCSTVESCYVTTWCYGNGAPIELVGWLIGWSGRSVGSVGRSGRSVTGTSGGGVLQY